MLQLPEVPLSLLRKNSRNRPSRPAELITNQLQDYIDQLLRIKTAIRVHDQATLYEFFATAKVTRDHLGPERNSWEDYQTFMICF